MARSLASVTRPRHAGISALTCSAERESFTLAANLSKSASYDWPAAAPVTVGEPVAGEAAPALGSGTASEGDERGRIVATSELVIVDTLANDALSIGAGRGEEAAGATAAGVLRGGATGCDAV
jgi:hypothetical protein